MGPSVNWTGVEFDLDGSFAMIIMQCGKYSLNSVHFTKVAPWQGRYLLDILTVVDIMGASVKWTGGFSSLESNDIYDAIYKLLAL